MLNKKLLILFITISSCKYMPYRFTENFLICFSKDCYKKHINDYDKETRQKILLYVSWVLEEQMFAVSVLENRSIVYECYRSGFNKRYYKLKRREFDYIISLMKKFKDVLIKEHCDEAHDFTGAIFIKFEDIYSTFEPKYIKDKESIYFLLKLEYFLNKNLPLWPDDKDFISSSLESSFAY